MKFLHLGAAVADMAKSLATYRDLFGYEVLSGPFDDPIQKVSVCFVGTGKPSDLVVELVVPNGEDSPVNKILAEGLSAYHVCYEVENLETSLSELRAQGCVAVSRPVPAVAFGGRRIAWLYTPTRQLLELVEQ